jgi:hypothetical protein
MVTVCVTCACGCVRLCVTVYACGCVRVCARACVRVRACVRAWVFLSAFSRAVGAQVVTLAPMAQPPVRDAGVCLTLLSDLTPMLPPDLVLDFHVEGEFPVSDLPGAGKVAVLIDNSAVTFHGSQRCNVRGSCVGGPRGVEEGLA